MFISQNHHVRFAKGVLSALARAICRRRIGCPPIEPDMIEGTNLQEAGLADFAGRDVQLHNDPVTDQALPGRPQRRSQTTL